MLAESIMSFLLLVISTGWRLYRRHVDKIIDDEEPDPAPPNQLVPQSWWIWGLIVSSIFCIAVVTPLCGMPIYEPAIAVIVALLVSVLAVRALGETDLNPVQFRLLLLCYPPLYFFVLINTMKVSGVGKLSQIVFGVVAPGNPVSNLIAGAIAEAGAAQAGDLMQDLKVCLHCM